MTSNKSSWSDIHTNAENVDFSDPKKLSHYSISKIIEPIKVDVENIASIDSPLNLANTVKEKYKLHYASQKIVEFCNDSFEKKDWEIVKQEILVRSNNEFNIETLLDEIESNWDTFSLFCYMFQNAHETIELNNTDTSFNVNISDVLNPWFERAIQIIWDEYPDIDNSRITFEILEDKPVPKDPERREIFFNTLRGLKNKGFNIAIDDIGWINEEGKLLNGNIDRVVGFLKEEVLDVIKLDKTLVRDLYAYYLWFNVNSALIRQTYAFPNTERNIKTDLKTIYGLHDLLKEEGVKIIAEWIDEFTVWGEKITDMKDFMRFLKDEIWVDQFQWYHLWKPMDPEEIYWVAA